MYVLGAAAAGEKGQGTNASSNSSKQSKASNNKQQSAAPTPPHAVTPSCSLLVAVVLRPSLEPAAATQRTGGR